MMKEQLAVEVIERLKKEYPDADVPWTMTRHGNFWSASVWRPSVRMPG